MKLVRCEEGHFYDKDKYPVCPNCSGILTPEMLKPKTSEPPTINQLLEEEPVTQVLPLTEGTLPPHLFMRKVDNVEEEKEGATLLQTTIDEVELFRSSAQIRRKGVFRSEEKYSKAVILGLPVTLREASIHIRAEEGLTCRKMSTFGYMEKNDSKLEDIRRKTEELLKKFRPIDNEVNLCKMKMKSLRRFMKTQAERTCTYSNYQSDMQSAGEEWCKWKEKHDELVQEAKELAMKISSLQLEQSILENEKKEACGLAVEFVSEPGKEYAFCLEYVVNEVGWSPSYDIRTYTNDSQIQIVFKADLRQNSGEDWKDVKLKLTTEHDLPSPDAANLRAQRISLMEMQAEEGYCAPYCGVGEVLSNSSVDKQAEFLPESGVATETGNEIQAQFTVNGLSSIENGMSCRMVLSSKKKTAKKVFFSVPKKECREYMGVYSESLDDEKLPDCFAGIYVNDAYSTSIHTSAFRENGIVVLGRVNGVALQYKTAGNKRKVKKISGQKQLIHSCEIHVENRMDHQAQILILDQIPISRNSDVEISGVNVGTGRIDEDGICRWEVSLNPHEKTVLPIEYVITYPQEGVLKWD